ncbi:hypothetical protein HDU78_002646 [Chytriomyces hyalinus]|nr:hypothetical protein HDU78_002646 [Chytriomyces hyalinus]
MQFQFALLVSLVTAINALKILVALDLGTRSHVVPFFNVAKLLHDRNHTIAYTAPTKYKKYQKGYDFMQFVPLGEYPPDEMEQINRWVHLPSDINTIVSNFALLQDMFAKTYAITAADYDRVFNETKPDLILCDFFSKSCMDVAHFRGFNYAVIGAPLGFDGWQAQWYIPSILNAVPQKEWITNPVLRVSNSIKILWAARKLVTIFPSAYTRIQKNTWGTTPPTFSQHLTHRLVLTHSIVGLTPSQPAPPNVLCLGPLLDPSSQTLDQDMINFFNQPGTERVIYISFGSGLKALGSLNNRILVGLKPILDAYADVSIVWSCPDSNCMSLVEEFIPESQRHRVMMRKWMDQIAVLKHEKVKLFITHGGISSIHEAVYFGVPLLVVPIFGDQPINALNVVANGIGLRIQDKATMQAIEVTEKVETLLKTMTTQNKSSHPVLNLQKVKNMKTLARFNRETSLLAGANAMEIAARIGVDHLIPANEKFSTWEVMGLGRVKLGWGSFVALMAGLGAILATFPKK